jgi:ribose transport system ATP-binding protein
VELIVGRSVDTARRVQRPLPETADHVVRVRAAAGGLVRSADLSIRAGEILGVTGLSGAGFEDLPYVLFGVGLATGGTIQVGSATTDLTSLTPLKASRSGMALVPADRHRDGAILSLPVLDNVSMQVLPKARTGFHLKRKELRRMSVDALRNFDVRPADPTLPCSSLSGGNQQKVLMAKWLQTQPAFLILHEPTQGVDVGAREEIYRVVREAADAGMAVLCASSDHEQLAALCDRVVVFRQGRIGPELTGDRLRKDAISQACYATPAESAGAELGAIVVDHGAITQNPEGKS